MADINNNLDYSEPINDNPSKEELVTEQPYYDELSAPAPQIITSNDNQPQIGNNDIPPSKKVEQENKEDTLEVQNYSKQKKFNHDKNYYLTYDIRYEPDIGYEPDIEQPVKRKYKMGENPRTFLILSIVLIAIVIADSVLQIYFSFFSPYVFSDDIAVFTLSIVYIVLVTKKKRLKHPALGAATGLVWFGGFGVKLAGMVNGLPKTGFIVPIICLAVARGGVMFFCIPHTCNNASR